MNLGIKSYRELSEKLNEVVKKAQEKITNDAFDRLNTNIAFYYAEFDPVQYDREYYFKKSPEILKVRKIGDTYFSSVGLKESYLVMHYPKSDSPDSRTPPPTGYEVACFANGDGYYFEHGVEYYNRKEEIGIFPGIGFWDKTVVVTYNYSVKKDYSEFIEDYTGCKCVRK